MLETRTAEGRAALDAAVLSALQGTPAQDINAIRAKAGGSLLQVRAALKRLIAAGKVDRDGRTRATRYTAAAQPGAEAA